MVRREKMIWRRKIVVSVFWVVSLFLSVSIGVTNSVYGNEEARETVGMLEEVVVSAPRDTKEGVSQTPTTTTIDLDDFQMVDIPQNIGNFIDEMIIFDFRGQSDLVPDNDQFQMRGFEQNRFVTAIDGLNFRKTGGRKASNIVDYTYLPPFLVEKIEILPGPHSALYPAKGIGGVLNVMTRAPRLCDTLKPNVQVTAGYRSYDTHNDSIYAWGSAQSFTYDLGYQKYATDGYLRNGDADIDSIFGRIGYVLPSGGHISFTGTYADSDRGIPVRNDPSDPTTDYDNDYPGLEKGDSLFNSWQEPSWDGIAFSYRFNYRQPTLIGDLSADAYYSEETRDRRYWDYVDSKDTSKGLQTVTMDTRYYQEGIRIMDEIAFSERHMTTLDVDFEKLWDGDNDEDEKDDRMEIFGAAVQHQWILFPRLTLKAGLRFENVDVRVSNTTTTGNYITGKGDWIKRSWNDWLPKSFLTYELDDLAPVLRDTSVSVGVSRIWHAPDYHGDYNPQGRPAGAWLDPEHGIGYDVVLMRRLFGDISIKLNPYYYLIKDYIATNSQFAEFTPSKSNPVQPGQEYKDYKINLDEVARYGVDVQFDGNILHNLSFYLGYAYQDFDNKGDELAGETELDDRAKHRVSAGLRYGLFKNTSLLLDYEFQDKQVIERAEEVRPDEWVVTYDPIDASHRVDFGVQQKLFDQWGLLSEGTLKLFVNNVLDEAYEDTNGYPGTDRTFGIGFSVKM